jgi:hypothetical protein
VKLEEACSSGGAGGCGDADGKASKRHRPYRRCLVASCVCVLRACILTYDWNDKWMRIHGVGPMNAPKKCRSQCAVAANPNQPNPPALRTHFNTFKGSPFLNQPKIPKSAHTISRRTFGPYYFSRPSLPFFPFCQPKFLFSFSTVCAAHQLTSSTLQPDDLFFFKNNTFTSKISKKVVSFLKFMKIVPCQPFNGQLGSKRSEFNQGPKCNLQKFKNPSTKNPPPRTTYRMFNRRLGSYRPLNGSLLSFRQFKRWKDHCHIFETGIYLLVS